MMNIGEFEHVLLLHGSDLAKWPDAAAAEAILAQDARARALLNESRRLDVIVAEATAYSPLDSASIGRVLACYPSRTAPRAVHASRLAAATALATCVVAGGFVLGQANAISVAQADIALFALASGQIDLLGELP